MPYSYLWNIKLQGFVRVIRCGISSCSKLKESCNNKKQNNTKMWILEC